MTSAKQAWRNRNKEQVNQRERERYRENREREILRVTTYHKQHRSRLTHKQYDIRQRRKLTLIDLMGSQCTDCGLVYDGVPEVFEFDHCRGEKVAALSQLFGGSWDRVMVEVAKCDLVCANCHRRRTYRRRIDGSQEQEVSQEVFSDATSSTNGRAPVG